MHSFNTSRNIAAPPAAIFAAFLDAERLHRWWGPAGFKNTYATCEVQTGGIWSFVMHGPDGQDYPNENVFVEVSPPSTFIIKHVGEPIFVLTIRLEGGHVGTLLHWLQVLEDASLAAKLAHIIEPANEQNLDRLTAEVLKA